MATIRTGDNAAAAPQTSVVIKLREKDGIALQYIGSLAYGVECQTSNIFYGIKAFGMEIVVQAGFQIFDYAVAILHDRCRDLQGAGAQQQKLQTILPGFDTAHAADM